MPAWIAWTLLTLVSWGLWATCPRLIGDALSPVQQQSLSTLGILPVLVALLAMNNVPVAGGNARRGHALAIGSGILSSLGNVAYYAAMKYAKAATVIPLTALAPLVTVVLAVPLLKERLSRLQWAGVGLSLGAIYLFNVPQNSLANAAGGARWMLLPLAAILLWGLTGLMQKAATNHISARSAAVDFLAAFLPLALTLLAMNPLGPQIAVRTWLATIAMGFTLALGNYTILKAFACEGKAALIAPLAGLYPLVSIPIALVAFRERLGGRELGGVLLALAAVVLLTPRSAPDPPTVVAS